MTNSKQPPERLVFGNGPSRKKTNKTKTQNTHQVLCVFLAFTISLLWRVQAGDPCTSQVRHRHNGETHPILCTPVCRDMGGGCCAPSHTRQEGLCSGWSHPGFHGKNTVHIQEDCETMSQAKVPPGYGLPGWGTPTAAPKPWHQTPQASLWLSEDALHRAALVKPPPARQQMLLFSSGGKREKDACPLQLHCWGANPGFPGYPRFEGTTFPPSTVAGHILSARSSCHQLCPSCSHWRPRRRVMGTTMDLDSQQQNSLLWGIVKFIGKPALLCFATFSQDTVNQSCQDP